MRQAFGPAALVLAILAVGGCGDSQDHLNHLAAAGSINEEAPVTAHLQIQIAASPAKVWALLVDVPSWPNWQKQIDKVKAAGPIESGARFSWSTGGTEIHSQVQLFEPEHRLSWTGTALTAKAIHVWELKPEPGGRTLLIVNESMEGPFMAKIFPPQKLAEADQEWLRALKQAAEQGPPL